MRLTVILVAATYMLHYAFHFVVSLGHTFDSIIQGR